LQQITGSLPFPFSVCSKQKEAVFCYFHFLYTYVYICCHFKRKTEALTIFLNPFTTCSLCKQKFVVFPFVDKETNRSFPFAYEQNGLNRLNRLAHLWFYATTAVININFSDLAKKNCNKNFPLSKIFSELWKKLRNP
jgi:hypothetical protein